MKVKYLSLLFCLTISCKSHNGTLFIFDPRNLKDDRFLLSEIADDIKYIQLDNSIPLGLIYDNIQFINNSIYLSEKDNGILVFEKTGILKNIIGNKGRGPGEYLYNYNFTVDEKTETIYVCDKNVIKAYSKKGELLRYFSLKEYGDFIYSIRLINFSLFAFYLVPYENSGNKWIVVDTLGNLIKKEKNIIQSFNCDFSLGQGAYVFQNSLTYWNSFDDTVFSISPDLNKTPSYIFYSGDLRVPKSSRTIPINELTKYLSVYKILETNHFLIIQYFYEGNKKLLLVEKENRKSLLTNWEFNGTSGIFNDLDNGPSFFPRNTFREDSREFLIGMVDPIQFKQLLISDEFNSSMPKYPNKKIELEKLAKEMKETDNPIIIIVRLKL